jgi:hypothetical protein
MKKWIRDWWRFILFSIVSIVLIFSLREGANADKFYIPLMCTPDEFKGRLEAKGLNVKWENEVLDGNTFGFITPMGNTVVLHVLGQPNDEQLLKIQDAINQDAQEK